MKKLIIGALIATSIISLGAKKIKAEPQVPSIEAQMERAEKIENYRAKKDIAWHKTEYNKVLKYVNKKNK